MLADEHGQGDGGHSDGDDRPRGNGRAGHGADLAGEEVPQHPTERDANRDTDGAADHRCNAGLDGNGEGELPPGEAEGLQDGEIMPSPPHGGDQCDAERDGGTGRQGDPRRRGVDPKGP